MLLKNGITIFLFSLMLAGQVMGESIDNLVEPLHYFKKHYTKEELKKIHELNYKILIEIENKTSFPPELKVEQVYYQWLKFPFISEANALGVDGKCFFGGWLTTQGSTWCHEPWKHTDDPQARDLGPTYDSENYCGGKNLFRCNPILFGKPKNPNPKLGRNPDRGICIKIDSYDHVTRTCAREASKYLDELVDKLKNDMSGLEKFLRHTSEILRYCEKDKLDYCEELKSYLEKVTERAKVCEQTEAADALPDVVPPLNDDEMRTVTEELGGNNSAPVKEIESDREDVVVVAPVKDENASGPAAESSLQSKLSDYTKDPATQKMINRMRNIYNKKCNDASCRGSKSNSPTGKCWRYVKHGLMGGGYADGYMEKNGVSYPYTATPSAKNAGKDFFNRPEVGFTNLLKTKEFEKMSSKDAPVGAILVYAGGAHGHVEVKTGNNEYISDFRTNAPIDASNPYRRTSRMLIGIYVKVD